MKKLFATIALGFSLMFAGGAVLAQAPAAPAAEAPAAAAPAAEAKAADAKPADAAAPAAAAAAPADAAAAAEKPAEGRRITAKNRIVRRTVRARDLSRLLKDIESGKLDVTAAMELAEKTENEPEPEDAAVPIWRNHGAPSCTIRSAQHSVSGLLTTVGLRYRPFAAGKYGGLRRGIPRLPSSDSMSALSSPHT